MHDIDLVIQSVSCLSAICERLSVSLGYTSAKKECYYFRDGFTAVINILLLNIAF